MVDPTDFGEKAFTVASNLFQQGKTVAKREARVIRLQTQISKLRARRQDLLLKMGEKVYDLFQRDLVKNQDLRMLCQQVRAADSELALRREEVAQIRAPETPGEEGVERDLSPQPEQDEEDEIIRG
jgi:phage shock protein A